MPDISMCLGGDCHQKDRCYRYTAEPNPYRQSYFCDPPMEEDKQCKYFWDNTEYKRTEKSIKALEERLKENKDE